MNAAVGILADQWSLVELDAQQGRSPAKGIVDAMVGLTHVGHRVLDRAQQPDRPAVVASEQIEDLGALLAREDVDVLGGDAAFLERPHRCHDRLLTIEEAGHPIGERKQMPARVRIAIDVGHGGLPSTAIHSLTETVVTTVQPSPASAQLLRRKRPDVQFGKRMGPYIPTPSRDEQIFFPAGRPVPCRVGPP